MREKSLWVRVMEAGFGATLEAHGFRRISPRLYRLEGDGIVWEQFTHRGPKSVLNAIREGHGAVVEGLDDLFRRAFGDRSQNHGVYPVRNGFCGRQYHAFGAIDSVFESVAMNVRRTPECKRTALLRSYDGMRRAYEESRIRYPTRWERLWRFLGLDRDRDELCRDLRKITPHFEWNQYTGDANFWCIGGGSRERCGDSPPYDPSPAELEELAGLLSRFWTDLVWPYRIGRQLSIYDRAVAVYNKPPSDRRFDPKSALFNHLAGRTDLARAHVIYWIEHGPMTPAQARPYLEEHDPDFLKRDPLDYGTPQWNMDPEDLAALRCETFLAFRREYTEQARHVAAAIGLRV